MTVDELLDRCVEVGVTHFRLEYQPGFDRFEGMWGWDLDRGDPVRWISVPKPWGFCFTWFGLRPHPSKSFWLLPFRLHWAKWRVGVHVGSSRHGWTGTQHDTFAAALRDALGKYLCDSEGSTCPHEVCEHHEDCRNDVWE